MFTIIPFRHEYRDDMIFCLLLAKDALGGAPRLNDDLLDIQTHYIAKGDMFWLALDEHNRVAGMVGVRQTSDTDAWLKRLYVKPGFKCKGIGRSLVQTAEDFALSKGIIYLHTRFSADYQEAAQFYPRLGFGEATWDGGLCHMTKHITKCDP